MVPLCRTNDVTPTSTTPVEHCKVVSDNVIRSDQIRSDQIESGQTRRGSSLLHSRLDIAKGSLPCKRQESSPFSLVISAATSAGVSAFSSSSLFTASSLQKKGTSYPGNGRDGKR